MAASHQLLKSCAGTHLYYPKMDNRLELCEHHIFPVMNILIIVRPIKLVAAQLALTCLPRASPTHLDAIAAAMRGTIYLTPPVSSNIMTTSETVIYGHNNIHV